MTRTIFPSLAAVVVALTLLTGVSSRARALDSDPWDRVLQHYAKRGGFDYAGLKADPTSMADLNTFLTSVGSMPESEPLSSWLNAYNALVVKAVVDHYPIRSVRDLQGFFDRTRYRVAGQQRTLDQLENQVIRPRFHDSRVHMALNCGARSCPTIWGRAFREASLSATLDNLARRMVASDSHVSFRNGQLQLSSLFTWFHDDFVRDGGSVLGWIRRYDQAHRLASVPDAAPQTQKTYNWQLNDAPAPHPTTPATPAVPTAPPSGGPAGS